MGRFLLFPPSAAIFMLLSFMVIVESSHGNASPIPFPLSSPSLIQAKSLANFAKYVPQGGEGSLKVEECAPKCDYRCSATSHKKPCLFFCNMCCKKCLCVPSGTYGHKEECPCYNNWKTKQGGPKCP